MRAGRRGPQPPFLVPETLNGSNIPYWQPYDSGRLPEYYTWTLNVQRQLPGRFVVEAGYNAQLGRHLTTNLLSLNQVDPAIFYGFVQQYGAVGRDQPDELAHGLDAGAPGEHSRIPIRRSRAHSRCVRRCGRTRSISTSTPAATAATAAGVRAITRSC